MASALAGRPKLRDWFYGYAAPERGTVVLGHRRVYILPTRLGWMFGATLGILLVGSINYALQLGFALTFLLAGMGLAGMVHTVRNLARLSLGSARAEPVFAGESAQFRLVLDNRARHDRPSLLVRHLASGAQTVLDLPGASVGEAVLSVPTSRRGWLSAGRFLLETRFPLGLFRAWSYYEPELRCLVYPRPEYAPLPAPHAAAESGASRAAAAGSDDFSGLRAYQLQDSPRHVAWKAVARTEDMLTKQFAGATGAELWLDEGRLPPGLDLEQRLSRLAGWVLSAERAETRYGLRVPGRELAPGTGAAHCAACLEALALRGLE
ncbi:MAG TPA: DUF58 domain-containing protein [Burkholderiales bacterium]|nr:DUF58 domain-containing protein [Burkholderiales bacterium]